jgi:hypothetical protein
MMSLLMSFSPYYLQKKLMWISKRNRRRLNTNVLMYEYFYNGGGVAVGDVNGDGYDDLYFTSNMNENKLYLNKTQMVFQDITAQAGVAGRHFGRLALRWWILMAMAN